MDADAGGDASAARIETRVEWVRIPPFFFLHLACLGVIWVGWSWAAVAVAAGLYFVRMFAITGFYHRYFSHRSFRRAILQFSSLFWATRSAQRGPLWWAAHHRHHHRFADPTEDAALTAAHGFCGATSAG